MRFRLTYEGELKASQKDPLGDQPDRLAQHKQEIRKVFHKQLKHLWQTNKFLREHRMDPTQEMLSYPVKNSAEISRVEDKKISMSEWVANNYRENGYRFVPLVRESISLYCSLDILFLRRDIPGSLISAGDLDNRIKTLIDTLRRPQNKQELRDNERPSDGEDPFYCLLEDDRLVTHLAVETDTLLDPPTGSSEQDARRVKLIVTVDLKPMFVTSFNLSFA
jgi:hypothetical protein